MSLGDDIRNDAQTNQQAQPPGTLGDQMRAEISQPEQTAKPWYAHSGFGGAVSSLIGRGLDAADAALSIGSSALLSPFATIAKASGDVATGSSAGGNEYFDKFMSLAHQPATDRGREYASNAADVINQVAPGLLAIAPQLGPIPKPILRQPVAEVAPAAQDLSATAPKLATASPELQQAVKNVQASGQYVDPAILNRHIEAESLPVPVKLSKGQASLNPAVISNEINSRGSKNALVSPDFYNQQAQALSKNLDVIRDKVAPDIAATHPTDMGQHLVDAYKQMDAPVVADIQSKYQALQDANGGKFPVDAKALSSNISSALDDKLLAEEPGIQPQLKTLSKMADNDNMDMQKYLQFRKNISNLSTSPDGNTRAAAGVMLQNIDELPLQGGASDLKPLADQARGAARARFQAMEADPAYKAAVNDDAEIGRSSSIADSFISKYVTGGTTPLADIQQMKANLANDPQAQQVIAAATIDKLKTVSGADPIAGKFGADSYNKNLTQLQPKLADLVGDEAAGQLGAVGRTAKITSIQPKGSYVSTANTVPAAAAEFGKGAVRSAAAIKTGGISEGLIRLSDLVKSNKEAQKSIETGAGIGQPNPPNP